MVKPAFEIRMVKENLDLSLTLLRAVQKDKVLADQLFRDGPDETFIAFAVDPGPDQIELSRRAANQVRAAFGLSVIQTQRSLERVFENEPIDEENPDLQAARCVMYLLSKTVLPSMFTPVWDCAPAYRRMFEARPIKLMVNTSELHGKGLSWDHIGGLPQYLELLGYLAICIEDLPEIERPAVAAPATEAPAFMASTVSQSTIPAPDNPKPTVHEPIVMKPTDPGSAVAPAGYSEVHVGEAEAEVVPASPEPAKKIDGPVARFIAERCDLGIQNLTTAKELYAGFQQWCRETGQDDVSQRSFGMQLTAMGMNRRRRGRGKHWWDGIRLSAANERKTEHATVGSRELMNGHYEGYQPELTP